MGIFYTEALEGAMTDKALDSVVLKDKQARFVEEYLVDSNATQAAIRAGYSEKSAYSIAGENMKKPEIVDAIAKGRAEIAERNKLTVDDLVKELEEARIAALTAENPQSSAAVAATMGKAKILGFLADKIDHTSSDGSMSPQAAPDYSRLSDDELRQYAKLESKAASDKS